MPYLRRESKLKKLDFIVIAAVLAVSALAFVLLGTADDAPAARVEIYVGGELANSIPLPETEEEFRIDTEYGWNILLLDSEGAKMADAGCPSLDCVRSAKITKPGQSIVCLPHRVVVRLSGAIPGDESGVDAVAG